MDWITSDGGPFICLDETLEPSWGGIDRLTIAQSDAKTDYDRACQSNDYASVIPILGGKALVFGMPFDTVILRASSGLPLIVQIEYSAPDLDDHVDKLVARIDEAVFDRPHVTPDLSVGTAALAVFDSAWPGDDGSKQRVTINVEPGKYRVLTRELQPDAETSLVMHKFVALPRS